MEGRQVATAGARTSATAPIVHLKGLYAVCRGGVIETQNDAPGGVVCGHLDTTSSGWNSLWWHLADCDILCKDYLGNTAAVPIAGVTRADPAVVTTAGHPHDYANGQLVIIKGVEGMRQLNYNVYTVADVTPTTFALKGNGMIARGSIDTTNYGAYVSGGTVQVFPDEHRCIGVYVPSSQPMLGNRSVNYYGRITNVHVQSSTTAFWFTDTANGHQLANVNWNGFYWSGLVLQGAYGNRAVLGFCDGAYQNGVIGIYLRERANPGAPSASTAGAMRNHVMGGTFEFGTVDNYGCYVSQDGRCTNNFVEFAFNTKGTILEDPAAGNTVIETKAPAVFSALTLGGPTPKGSGSQVSLGNTTTSSARAGDASAVPSKPAGYWSIDIGGNKRLVPFYLP